MRTVLAALCLGLALAGCVRTEDARPAWDEAALDDLENVAASVAAEGLAPETEALEELARFRHLARTDPVAEAQTDVAADALFTSLARAFAQGGVDPRIGDPEWRIPLSPAPDLEALRTQRAQGRLPSALLAPLLPQNEEYSALRGALARVTAETAGARDADGVTREDRIRALRASMERWRWLPRALPERRIEVRIAQIRSPPHRAGRRARLPRRHRRRAGHSDAQLREPCAIGHAQSGLGASREHHPGTDSSDAR